jgi:hypothetical protein
MIDTIALKWATLNWCGANEEKAISYDASADLVWSGIDYRRGRRRRILLVLVSGSVPADGRHPI